jgi:prophage antirepressor-like protein
MNTISIFTYTDKQIRTIVIGDAIWFVAKDVCDLLDIKDTWNAMQRLPDSMKGTDTVSTPGGPQQMAIVNEAGVYKLAFTSRKPEAEGFTDFVAGTILPTIRQTGLYQTRPMSPAELLQAQANLLVEQEKRIERVEARQEAITRALMEPAQLDWVSDMNARLNYICKQYRHNYQQYRQGLYIRLEADARVDLRARQENLRKRLKAAGHKVSDIEAVTKIHVIADDPKLRKIFEAMIRIEQIKFP